jgi:uncharacterized membrane protein
MASARSFIFRLALAALMLAAAVPLARADYRLCNRTGYILDAALAIETEGATATQGWFRVLPGACSVVLAGAAPGERYFVHTRTPAFYGERPEAADISRMFCVLPEDFLLPGATGCGKTRGALVGFSEVVAERTARSATAVLTDGTAASLDGARKAAIQRLAAIAGYDPGPADGVYRAKTLAALTRFQTARGLADAGLMSDALVEALYEAAVQAGEAATATGSIDEAPAE